MRLTFISNVVGFCKGILYLLGNSYRMLKEVSKANQIIEASIIFIFITSNGLLIKIHQDDGLSLY